MTYSYRSVFVITFGNHKCIYCQWIVFFPDWWQRQTILTFNTTFHFASRCNYSTIKVILIKVYRRDQMKKFLLFWLLILVDYCQVSFHNINFLFFIFNLSDLYEWDEMFDAYWRLNCAASFVKFKNWCHSCHGLTYITPFLELYVSKGKVIVSYEKIISFSR